jgi:hypothetical protein
MPGNKAKKPGKKVEDRMVRVQGPGGFRLDFPIPRLPSWLGAADRLNANAAIYPRVNLDFPITIFNVAVVAGALAQTQAVDVTTLIPNWSSRIQNLFREYCVVGLRMEFTLTSVTNPSGVVVVFVDETLATTPNAGSLFVPHMEVPIVQNPDGKVQLLSYMPSGSYTDLEWTPCASPVVRQWVKFYAATGTGTGGTTAATINCRGTIALCFRGFANF